jgi:hypothetical protein
VLTLLILISDVSIDMAPKSEHTTVVSDAVCQIAATTVHILLAGISGSAYLIHCSCTSVTLECYRSVLL